MKENLMVVCYDYALARRVSKSLAEFLEMRFFDMLEMFKFNNFPHALSDILKVNGRDYAIKEMRSVIKTELDCSGIVFVAEPKMLGLNQDLFDKLKERNLILYLKRDCKTEFAIRERTPFKTQEEKEFFQLEIDELSENSMNVENNLADLIVDINDLGFEDIKKKIQKTLEIYAG